MPRLLESARRLLVGRPFDTARLRRRPLGRGTALPVYSANAFSSTAYAPDEILMTLALGGVALLALGPQIGLAVVAVMLLIVLSYRVSVCAYPRGGDYQIASSNLGPRAGVTVAAAMMLDLVFTVAVSVAALAQYLIALVPGLAGRELWIALGAVLVLALANVRGAGRGRRITAVLVYLFLAGVLALLATGLVQENRGTLSPAASAGLTAVPDPAFATGVGALAMGVLVLRAFSSGSALATGVEVPASNVASMAQPRIRTARFVMLVMGLLTAVMTFGVMHLAAGTGVVVTLEADSLRQADGGSLPSDYVQHPVLAQLARAVFGEGTVPSILLISVVVALLGIAGQSAFSSFPDLVSRLATDGYLPRQLATRGDRLTFTRSILLLALAALILVVVFRAQTALLVQLYVIGVFLAFTLSQLGMVRHWRRTLVTTAGRQARTAVRTRLVVSTVGFAVTALVAIVVLTTRFVQGAWVALLAIGLLVLVMTRVRGHYQEVSAELALTPDQDARALPSRVHALILVSTVHRPTLRALAYARASRPSTLQAVVVDLDAERTEELLAEWDRLQVEVPVTVLASPYREMIAPLIRHLRALRRTSPRDLVVVYIPEYVVAPGWHTLLHNRTAARIKQRLHREPGVMVASVPWQLQEALEDLGHDDAPRLHEASHPERGAAGQ
ncbi:APC family permease [Micrococcus terreus]|uniref:APC family permease n=1 Tax=Micrococcus terreus TaxID=574650 RepID=UPI00254D2B41|nr:APC family permease [Micrococcus terreus]MDK7700216.1 APC family permease [Micrococcus terreus]WOO98458.1 APC family permease [Micrococcus terreus]